MRNGKKNNTKYKNSEEGTWKIMQQRKTAKEGNGEGKQEGNDSKRRPKIRRRERSETKKDIQSGGELEEIREEGEEKRRKIRRESVEKGRETKTIKKDN